MPKVVERDRRNNKMNTRRVELSNKNKTIFYNLDIKTFSAIPEFNKVDIFIYPRACNNWTKTWADLSGPNGNVAIAPIEYEGYRYSVPKWVKAIIKSELLKENK